MASSSVTLIVVIPCKLGFEVEHESGIGAYVSQSCSENDSSIVYFDFKVGQSCRILLNVDLVIR